MRRVYLAQYSAEVIPNKDGSGVLNFAVPFLQDGENVYDEDAHDWPACSLELPPKSDLRFNKIAMPQNISDAQPSATLPDDYAARVYAGVLGKIIGVYLGRPFEQWAYEKIESTFGDVKGYVHEKVNVPLIVTDDDITGTFTFVRALEDNGCSAEITAEQIGWNWLNYIIENRTILWWGGLGYAAEHTAFLRLKNGIPAPRSGSLELNGWQIAEEIGSQIFIEGWAMVAPGNPNWPPSWRAKPPASRTTAKAFTARRSLRSWPRRPSSSAI